MAGLSVAGGAAQMINAKKKADAAKKAIQGADSTLKNVREVNKMASLQAPDISSMASQDAAATTAQSLQSLQEMGGAGAAGVAGVYKQGLDSQLEAQQRQGEVNYNRDVAVASNAQGIEQRRSDLEANTALMEAQGAQGALADAGNQMWSGLQSTAGGLAQGATAYGDLTGPYATNKSKDPAWQQFIAQGGDPNDAEAWKIFKKGQTSL